MMPSKKSKSISSGIILRKNKTFLIIHPTNNTFWNIPKGLQEEGETFKETAIRETREETGLCFSIESLTPLGEFSYLPTKDLILFENITEDLPDINTMKCTSFFKYKDVDLPEIDHFLYVEFETLKNYLNPSLLTIFEKIYGENAFRLIT